jgi:hypothetical protein
MILHPPTGISTPNPFVFLAWEWDSHDITSEYGPRNRSPLKWIMSSVFSAIQTTDSQAICERNVCIVRRLVMRSARLLRMTKHLERLVGGQALQGLPPPLSSRLRRFDGMNTARLHLGQAILVREEFRQLGHWVKRSLYRKTNRVAIRTGGDFSGGLWTAQWSGP